MCAVNLSFKSGAAWTEAEQRTPARILPERLASHSAEENGIALHSCDSDVTTSHHPVLDRGFAACSLKWVGTIFYFRTGSKMFCGKTTILKDCHFVRLPF